MSPEVGKYYRYVGPEPGTNELHRVIEVEDGQVVTWGMTKMTWFGTVEEFRKFFVEAK